MLDFLRFEVKKVGKSDYLIPIFAVRKSSDLMIRGGDFYAIWDEERQIWSTDEEDVVRLIDVETDKAYEEKKGFYGDGLKPRYMWDSSSGLIDNWHKYCQKQMRDNYHQLDDNLLYANTKIRKEDYATKRLPYPLEPCDTPSYETLISTLYDPEERHKIEWAIGAVVTGASKQIQKFLVFYGAAGTGKSTIMNIIQQLFEGYYAVFDAKALGSNNSSFALEAFRGNPLVAIQHDGDLSRIEDNTRLNSLVSHELMIVNEKYKSTYSNRFNAFLFMGTNRPVKITDAKSGIIRRLIDVVPSGRKLKRKEYNEAVKRIKFELGGIACRCRDVYLANPDAYDDYIPRRMMGASNDFYNFVLDSYPNLNNPEGVLLKTAWKNYKEYCEEARVPYPYSQMIFKEELKNYYKEFKETEMRNGSLERNIYYGFRTEKFEQSKPPEISEKVETVESDWLIFKEQKSLFDTDCRDCLAQYGNEDGLPLRKWVNVQTHLSDLETDKLHYVKLPENHIVIDFDIPNKEKEKDFELNFNAARSWPSTYAELSKSGKGIHLHYIYTGDPTELARVFGDHIEVKVFTGNSSLRRKLTLCNDIPIATIGSGLPLKEKKKMLDWKGVRNEKMLRSMIIKNLRKQYHHATKPSVDYIYKLLEDAYENGVTYDVSDMHSPVLAFAAGSTNQSEYCIDLVGKMRWASENSIPTIDGEIDDPLIFYDVEVFPNLFLVNWKAEGEENSVIRMINPTPRDIEKLMEFRLIGFNCRRYDNHILYARSLGYTNEQLYYLSQKIISGDPSAMFGNAYNVSYTDVYDFAAKKQSLKKWEIELGIHHKELGLPWDQPVPEDRWEEVAAYCDNDVLATEAVFHHLKGDWTARQILAELAGGSVNDTTNQLTTKIIFGNEKKPKLIYTDLATGEASDPRYQRNDIVTAFPGYEFKDGKNWYRGVDVGKGGYVYSEPGMYWNVALLDIASMHPNSIIAMNCFGEYTEHFKDILNARIAIKHKDYESARHLFGGKLEPYLEDESTAKDLAQALKIAINSVYGLTAANFDNPFRDIRNKNNIVALRGALFMKTLQDEVQAKGYTVCHIKTDSIKIADATPEIIQFCMDFAKQYGYTFEHEATYEKMCLVNDAVYIAKYKEGGEGWTATGTQFAVPYVFKTLFSKEPIEFNDLCETKSVKTAIYLDMNEALPDVTVQEKEIEKLKAKLRKSDISNSEMEEITKRLDELDSEVEQGHNYIFVGKVGRFCPIKPGCGGGLLVRHNDKTHSYDAVTGSKGYRWLESEMVQELDKENDIDRSYYNRLVDDAVEVISQYGDFEAFCS